MFNSQSGFAWLLFSVCLPFLNTSTAHAVQPYNTDFDVVAKGTAPSAVASFYMVLNHYNDQQVFKGADCETDIPLTDVEVDRITGGSQVWKWINGGSKSGITLSQSKNAAQGLFTDECRPYYSAQINTDFTYLNKYRGLEKRKDRLEHIKTNYLSNNYPVIIHMKPRYSWHSGFYVVLIGFEDRGHDDRVIHYASPRDGGKIETVREDDFLGKYFYHPGAYYRARWDGTWTGFSRKVQLPGNYKFSVKLGGYTRRYNVHIPEGYDGSEVPLVVNFHGFLSNADIQQSISKFDEVADDEGFIVAYPQGVSLLNTGLGHAWNSSTIHSGPPHPYLWPYLIAHPYIDDVKFAETVVREISEKFEINRRRIYLAGLSQGGAMALLCAHGRPPRDPERHNMFAAVAVASSGLSIVEEDENGDLLYQPDRPIAAVMFHGYNDEYAAYEGGGELLGVSYDGPSVPAMAKRWAEKNGCEGNLQGDSVDILDENGLPFEYKAHVPEEQRDKTTTYTDCDNGVEVKLYSLLDEFSYQHNLYQELVNHKSPDYIARESWNFLKRFTRG